MANIPLVELALNMAKLVIYRNKFQNQTDEIDTCQRSNGDIVGNLENFDLHKHTQNDIASLSVIEPHIEFHSGNDMWCLL